MPPPRAQSTGTAAKPTAKVALRQSAMRTVEPGYAKALLEYAEVMYKGGFGGKDCNRAEAIAAKIEVGRDLGLPPTQAIANIMILNGKPSIYGDAGMALIRGSGLMAECDDTYEGDPEPDANGKPTNRDFTAVFTIRRVGVDKPRVARFSVQDAIQAGLWNKPGPWQNYTTRQLMWRAKSFACRDEFQDVLCGCVFTEEALDYPGVRQTEPITVETVNVEMTVTATTIPDDRSASSEASAASSAGASTTTVTDTTAKTSQLATGPVTNEQLQRLAELRQNEFAARSLREDDNESKVKIWSDYLSHYFVDSAKKLTSGQADDLIHKLESKHEFPKLDAKTGLPPS